MFSLFCWFVCCDCSIVLSRFWVSCLWLDDLVAVLYVGVVCIGAVACCWVWLVAMVLAVSLRSFVLGVGCWQLRGVVVSCDLRGCSFNSVVHCFV